ncbi:F-box domain-containing protein [Blumeria hordei DH14]|uniref:F-box domain-containing protein n=1 Tax=Blumeria graminis f. sp. hordei (strain DH14) TaxID=546991 RepID=N1JLC9_BLUG1|nr:F-box domain-containing protein [Blumeria hordei DH14]
MASNTAGKFNIETEKLKSFYGLPDELIQQILFYCMPNDILYVQRVCKKLYRLGGEPLLWRHHCLVDFDHWDAKHKICEKFNEPSEKINWKILYKYRNHVDVKTTKVFESILHSQVDRISKYQTIADFGYDAKDTLLRHCHENKIADDTLSRRYYAKSVLDFLHRCKALEVWQGILDGENIPLEVAIGSFDMFTIHDEPGDLYAISEVFENLAEKLRLQCPGIQKLPTSTKAKALNSFFKKLSLTEQISSSPYLDLKNYYIGTGLNKPGHPLSSLTCVIIYCALGKKIGLDARVCNIPGSSYAMIFPNPDESLGPPYSDEEELENNIIYLDPNRFMEEISITTLRQTLSGLGLPPKKDSEYLTQLGVSSVIQHMSRCILASVSLHRTRDGKNLIRRFLPATQAEFHSDMKNAYYSALWANIMFINHLKHQADKLKQRRLIRILLDEYISKYPMDGSLIEKHILPLHDNSQDPEFSRIKTTLNFVRTSDKTPKRTKLCRSNFKNVKYKVGQVFSHKRYRYIAVITGWDSEVRESNGIDPISQSYPLSQDCNRHVYLALAEDTSIRYVSEENIEIIEPEQPLSLMSQAGKYFKRWDAETHTFISGIKDEYPED